MAYSQLNDWVRSVCSIGQTVTLQPSTLEFFAKGLGVGALFLVGVPDWPPLLVHWTMDVPQVRGRAGYVLVDRSVP